MNYNDIYFKSILGYMILGVVVASFIGSIVSIIWLFFSKRATKFYIPDSVKYQRIILLCFILPVIPFVFYPIYRNMGGIAYTNLNNPMMDKLLVLVGIWGVVVAIVTIYRIFHYYCMCKTSKDNIPLQDETILSKLAYWKGILGIKKEVKISVNPHILSPAILHHKGYQILFPSFEMTDEQMEIALLHELVHLKNKDVVTKDLCFLIQVLHGWNPLVYYLKKSIIRWAEVVCDLTACELGKAHFSAKDYYNVILEMMKQVKEGTQGDIMLCLFEKESMMRFRIDKFKLANKTNLCRRKRFLFVSLIILLLLSVLTYAITTYGLYVWHESSLVELKQEKQQEEVKIHYNGESVLSDVSKTYVDAHDLKKALDDKQQLGKNELWEIDFVQNQADNLDFFVFTNSKKYIVGYISNGEICCFDGSETMSYNFDSEKIEKVFIKNCSESIEFDVTANARRWD